MSKALGIALLGAALAPLLAAHGSIARGALEGTAYAEVAAAARSSGPGQEIGVSASIEDVAFTPGWVAPHAPMPRIRSQGGPVIKAPHVVPIAYAGDPLAPHIAAFLGKLATTSYFHAQVAEYGVGPLTLAPAITISDPPPAVILDTDVGIWLAGKVSDGSLPAPDANTVYLVTYPEGTTVEYTNYGYDVGSACFILPPHKDFTTAAGSAAFAVVPRCADGTLGMSPLDYTTLQTDVALVGAVTNPYSATPAFDDPDWDASGWSVWYNVEVSGLCLFQPDGSLRPADLGYLIPRTWSNAAAAAGHDPCVPVAAAHTKGGVAPYFNAAPEMDGTEPFPFYFTKGLSLAPGESVTIPVRLFSDGPTARWQLSAVENPNPSEAMDANHVLSFKFDEAEGRNGDLRHLTVTRTAAADGTVNPRAFAIVSTLGTRSHEWIVTVGQ